MTHLIPPSYPQLETKRLILRGPTLDDFETVRAFGKSPRSAAIGGPWEDDETVWRGFLSSIGHWCVRGYGFFMVTLHDGIPVGRVGILNHITWPEPELGWQLFDGFEGKGYAYEAALAARAWGAKQLGFTRLISLIEPENKRSIALAERLGAVVEGSATIMGDITCLKYRHPAQIGEQT